MTSRIPFEQICDAALGQAERLLRDWFPAGRVIGREFKIGNLRGDPGDSLSVNLDSGKWADFADGASGFDLIDLRAAIAHGGNREAAARELGNALGLMNVHDKHAPPWQPIVPPPNGTARPDAILSGFDRVHEYRDATDRILFYIGRIEARGKQHKLFVPVTFGTLEGVTGWHKRAPATPRPLYGLDRIAKNHDAAVILCDGEKAADAARVLFPDYVCMTWPGVPPLLRRQIFLRWRSVTSSSGQTTSPPVRRPLRRWHGVSLPTTPG